MKEIFIVGNYNDSKQEYYLFELCLTDNKLFLKHFKTIRSPTKLVRPTPDGIKYEIPSSRANLEKYLEKYSKKSKSKEKIQDEKIYSVEYREIDRVTLSYIFMSNQSYYCNIELKTNNPIFQNFPMTTMNGKNFGFLLYKKNLKRLQSSLKKYCRGKVNLYYNKYKGSRLVKYLLTIATIWVWFIGWMGAINNPNGQKIVIIAGITMIFITFFYSFRKNPNYTSPEDPAKKRYKYRLKIISIILLIIFILLGMVMFFQGLVYIKDIFNLPREAILLIFILILLFLKRKSIIKFINKK